MKKIILTFGLLVCFSLSVLGQETPIELIQETRILVKDSADLVENPKAIAQEAKALIQSLKELEKVAKKSKKEGKSYKFQLGLTYQSLNFQNYGDEDKSGGARLLKANRFNGFSLGLTFRKPFTKHFALKAEFTYAQQNEKYEFSTVSFGTLDGDMTYLYDGKVEIDYNLLKMPILADYSLAFGTQNTWFLHGYAGLQFSYLTSYIPFVFYL